MEKITINVPRGVRYISDWKEFKLPEVPTIINKKLTGCGFTEWCLTNSDNVILVSPRRILLENKEDQHVDDNRILYVRNDGEKVINYDKDLESKRTCDDLAEDELSISSLPPSKDHIIKLHEQIMDHYKEIPLTKGCKFLVTYDSFRHIRETLGDRINSFYIVIDEFQSIFTDAKFKSTTGVTLLEFLVELNRVCFVSATPMIDKYLELLDEFRDLPYVDLDWEAEDPNRVIKPQITQIKCKSIIAEAKSIIDSYKNGEFETFTTLNDDKKLEVVVSTEAVIYVNSVKNICDIISKCKLTLENTNILCARTSENQKKLIKAFGVHAKTEVIGKVPKKGEPHKMFTLCTRTVYLGADFYSTCARSFVFSDANIDSLSVDISLDLPQILGRQRLLENPWKNRVDFYYKTTLKTEKDFEELRELIESKKKVTEDYLNTFESSNVKDSLIKVIETSKNYSSNYIVIKEHSGSNKVLDFNRLVMIADIRTYEISKNDYKNSFSVFNAISGRDIEVSLGTVDRAIEMFYKYTQFQDRMQLVCELDLTEDERRLFLERVPLQYKKYYETLGPDKCRALGYVNFKLSEECDTYITKQKDDLLASIYDTFKVGERYSKSYIKQTLGEIYDVYHCTATPKASDLGTWFEIKICNVLNSETGKRDKGFEILKKL